MANITLKQLRYFDALSVHRHFGQAASACSITQPALSVQIKELETELGAPLFERSARQVRLTRFGEEFAPRARDILRGVDELGDLSRAARGKLAGRFRLGVIPTVAPYLLPAVIAKLSVDYPDLDLHVRETRTARLVQELLDGRIEAAIVALPVSEPLLSEIALFTEEFVLVRPVRDANRPVPDRTKLREMRLMLLEEGHCFRDQALSFCETSPSRELLDGSSLSTLVQLVGAGIGVTLLPEMAIPIETSSAAVAISHFPDPQPARTVGIIWRKSSMLQDQLMLIADVVRDCADNGSIAAKRNLATG